MPDMAPTNEAHDQEPGTERSLDPRVALLVAQDRRLGLVGKATMSMMLAAAEAAGLIPEGRTEVLYGVFRSPSEFLYPQRNANSALAMIEIMKEGEPTGQTYIAVTMTRTSYPDRFTEWEPVPAPEEAV